MCICTTWFTFCGGVTFWSRSHVSAACSMQKMQFGTLSQTLQWWRRQRCSFVKQMPRHVLWEPAAILSQLRQCQFSQHAKTRCNCSAFNRAEGLNCHALCYLMLPKYCSLYFTAYPLETRINCHVPLEPRGGSEEDEGPSQGALGNPKHGEGGSALSGRPSSHKFNLGNIHLCCAQSVCLWGILNRNGLRGVTNIPFINVNSFRR